MSENEKLWVVTCVSNPLRWRTRIDLARRAIADWLREPNVHVTLVECTYGSRPYQLADLASDRVNHVPVKAHTMAWCKESMLNIGISRLPPEAKKIATLDCDILFRKPGWATDTLHALNLYGVVQTFDKALDLGPTTSQGHNGDPFQMHHSFCSLYHRGQPVVPDKPKFWDFDGGPYRYSHPGFAWAWQRSVLDWVGLLFEHGGMGSADHHQALSLVGAAEWSMPGGTSDSYRTAVLTWQERALAAVNRKIGFVHGTIEHLWHGSKPRRSYQGRWSMFLEHGFDPVRDLKRNSYSVLEFSGNKPELERQWANYLSSRSEDANVLD